MRRRHKYDIYLVIFLAIFTLGYFIYNNVAAGSKGVENYSQALKSYKENDFEQAFVEFGKIPHNSTLKQGWQIYTKFILLFLRASCEYVK